MKAIISFLFGVALLLCYSGVSAVDCSSFTDCATCTSQESQCAWITDKDCKQKCRSAKFPQDTLSMPYRRIATTDKAQCANHQTCSIVSDADLDSSLENDKWSKVGVGNAADFIHDQTYLNAKGEGKVQIFDGDKVAWFGRFNETISQELYINYTIPPKATHLSFFLLCSIEGTSHTELALYIDDEFITYFDADRCRDSDVLVRYRNFDINIKSYAGKKHSIRFLYYGTSAGDHALLDYITFISDPTHENTDWLPCSKWPPSVECAPGCQTRYIKDLICDPLCNNIMCGFDNGACEGDKGKYIVQRAHYKHEDREICYSRQEVRNVGDQIDVCPMYTDSDTCCIFAQERNYVKEQLDNITSKCKVESKCNNILRRVFCVACSPRSNNFYHAGRLQLCDDFASSLYELCSSSYFLNNVTGECTPVNKLYKSKAVFVDMFGDAVLDNCFNGDDSVAEGLSMIMIIVIAVVGAVVVVVIIVIIVAAVVHHKKKKAETVAIEMDGLDPANNMTIVPVDGNDGNIIYIDENGDVAGDVVQGGEVSVVPAEAVSASVGSPNPATLASLGSGGRNDSGIMSVNMSNMQSGMMMNPMMLNSTNVLSMSGSMMQPQM